MCDMHKLSPSMENKWKRHKVKHKAFTHERSNETDWKHALRRSTNMLDAAFDKSQEVICFPTPQKEKDFRRGHAFHAHSIKGITWPTKASLQKASRRNQQSWPSSHFAKTSLSSRHSPHRPWISKDPTSDNQHHASKIVQQTHQPLLIFCPPLNIKAGRCVLTWEPLALITTCASSYTKTNNAWPTDTCEYITANNKKNQLHAAKTYFGQT
jgi:hypothetical protein